MTTELTITPPPAPAYRRGVHLLAQVTTVLAFVVICLGGYTKSKEAGLTIPQPVFYEVKPDWVFIENLNAEYTHRAMVAILSCSTLALVIGIFAGDTRRGVKKLALAAFVLLLAQAVVGALTAHFFAKAHTSIPHAVLGQSFLCVAAALAALTSRAWVSDAPAIRSVEQPALHRLGVYCIIALFVQLLLGAALRHDGQGAALRNGNEHIFVWHLAAHFAGAIVATVFIARLISRVFNHHRQQPEIFKPVKLMMMLLGVQLLLGFGAAALKVLTIEQHDWPPPLRVFTATTHLAIGALLLALSVVTTVRAHRFVAPVTRTATEPGTGTTGEMGSMGVAV